MFLKILSMYLKYENYPSLNVGDGHSFLAQVMNVSGISFTAFSSILEKYHVWLIFSNLLLLSLLWFQDTSESIMNDFLKEGRWVLILDENNFCSIQTLMEKLPCTTCTVDSVNKTRNNCPFVPFRRQCVIVQDKACITGFTVPSGCSTW